MVGSGSHHLFNVLSTYAPACDEHKHAMASHTTLVPAWLQARASLLFFCISDLAAIDPMYQYSLAWFSSLFVRAMADAEASDDIAARGAILNEYFTYSLYVNVCRSLFEAHKLLLSLLLATKILAAGGGVDAREWRFLLAGPTRADFSQPNPAPEWLTAKAWTEVLNVAELPAFAGFADSFVEHIDVYKVCVAGHSARFGAQAVATAWRGVRALAAMCVLAANSPQQVHSCPRGVQNVAMA
jgi:hypothetical protein